MDFYIPKLTDREDEVFSLYSEGYRKKAISKKLHISINTVGTHINNVYNKLGLAYSSDKDIKILAILKYIKYKNAKVFFEQKTI